MENQNVAELLARVYKILKFTDDEIKGALGDLAGIQQVVLATEMIKSLTPDEVKTINGLAQAPEEEKKAMMEKIAKAHAEDADLKSRAKAAAKKVLYEHVIYLKTRGDENQKAEIAKILAGII